MIPTSLGPLTLRLCRHNKFILNLKTHAPASHGHDPRIQKRDFSLESFSRKTHAPKLHGCSSRVQKRDFSLQSSLELFSRNKHTPKLHSCNSRIQKRDFSLQSSLESFSRKTHAPNLHSCHSCVQKRDFSLQSSPESFSRNKHPPKLHSCNSHVQKRDFSLQSSLESFSRTQSGLFKWLSESAPVEYVQGLLLNVHDFTGLPWWATIVCTTVLLRSAVTVPLAVYQQYILAKVENLNMEMPDIVKELKVETAMAIRRFNWDERTAKIHFKRSLKIQYNNLIIRDNCHPVKASLLIWFQIPMWISFSVSLRNLVYELPKHDLDAKLTLAELSLGGFGWIPNLTEIDSSLILPVTLGLLNLTIIEIQSLSKVNVPSKFQRYITNFFKGFSLLMIPIAASVPSCLALYWTTSSAFGLVQNMVLMSPKVKRFCRIPNTPSQVDKPYLHVVEGFKHKYSFSNKLFKR